MFKYRALPKSPPGTFKAAPRCDTETYSAKNITSRAQYSTWSKLLTSTEKWKIIVDAQMMETPSPLRMILLLHAPNVYEVLYLHQLAQSPIDRLLQDFHSEDHTGGYFSEGFFHQLRSKLHTSYYLGSVTPIFGMTETTIKDFYLRIPFCDNCKTAMEYSKCSEMLFFCLTCGATTTYKYPFLSTGLRYTL